MASSGSDEPNFILDKVRSAPTGAKLFFILVVALLPIALVALLLTTQILRTSDQEARTRLKALTEESSSTLQRVLQSHAHQLFDAMEALQRNPANSPACARLAGTFGGSDTSHFGILNGRRQILCGRTPATQPPSLQHNEIRAQILENGLQLSVGGTNGAIATIFYPANILASVSRPNGFVPQYALSLLHDDSHEAERLMLHDMDRSVSDNQRETARHNIGMEGLAIEMSVPRAPFTSLIILVASLHIIMWIAAAAAAWLVVNNLLIRPMRQLQARVGAYEPGEVIDLADMGTMPAQELRDLGDTFRTITQTVQAHEADLAEGLVRQTKLTREVHHRVKNNLQVISSLINFHARGAQSPDVAEAYASIQRRVDALAVVHRHHYAELEENRGLELRPVIGEMAANIRGTAPAASADLVIRLDVQPVLVNQDVATAISFLLTEIVELAMSNIPDTQIRISVTAANDGVSAKLRIVSPALVESEKLRSLSDNRYGRIISGLARQLRTTLHYEPLVGAYEANISINPRS